MYIAGPLSQARALHDLAHDLATATGCEIVSGWHEEVTRLRLVADPVDKPSRARILDSNLRDLRRADFVVAVTDLDRPRATLCEIGYALALGLRVAWVQGQDGAGANSFDASPLVQRIVRQAEDSHGLLLSLADVLDVEQRRLDTDDWTVLAGDACGPSQEAS